MKPETSHTHQLCTRGDHLYDIGKYQEAESYYRDALSVEPAMERALDSLVGVYFAQGQLAKARQVIETLQSHHPASLHTWFRLAYWCYYSKQYKEAHRQVDRVLEINPEYLGAYVLLAQIYYQDRVWSKALAAINQALSYAPNQYTCLVLKAKILGRLGYTRARDRLLSEALRQNPESPQVFGQLATQAWQRTDYSLANSYLEAALRLDPNDQNLQRIYLRLARTHSVWYRHFSEMRLKWLGNTHALYYYKLNRWIWVLTLLWFVMVERHGTIDHFLRVYGRGAYLWVGFLIGLNLYGVLSWTYLGLTDMRLAFRGQYRHIITRSDWVRQLGVVVGWGIGLGSLIALLFSPGSIWGTLCLVSFGITTIWGSWDQYFQRKWVQGVAGLWLIGMMGLGGYSLVKNMMAHTWNHPSLLLFALLMVLYQWIFNYAYRWIQGNRFDREVISNSKDVAN